MVHFSGKQYYLNCSIVEPGECVCTLSDDTNLDPIFVNEVLEDIFKRLEIKDEAIISDNARTQYKNLYAFKSMQNLSGRYNVRLIQRAWSWQRIN